MHYHIYFEFGTISYEFMLNFLMIKQILFIIFSYFFPKIKPDTQVFSYFI